MSECGVMHNGYKVSIYVTKCLEIHSAEGYITYWFERQVLCDIFHNSTIKIFLDDPMLQTSH